jgi:hypothetical protein
MIQKSRVAHGYLQPMGHLSSPEDTTFDLIRRIRSMVVH